MHRGRFRPSHAAFATVACFSTRYHAPVTRRSLTGSAIAGGGGGGGDTSKGAGPSSAALLAAGAGVTRPARYKVLVIFTGDRQAHWVGV